MLYKFIAKPLLLLMSLVLLTSSQFADAACGSPSQSDYSKTPEFKVLEQKALAGDAIAQYEMSEVYRMNWYGFCDDEKEVYWLKKSAVSGYSKAQSILGSDYEHGWSGVKKDPSMSLYWYRKAAQQGYPMAMYELGYFYQNGINLKKDINQAIAWYTKATSGYAPAYYDLAMIYLDGDGIPKNPKKARELLQLAIDKDDRTNSFTGMSISLAENQLGKLNLLGQGGEQNVLRAAQLFQSSASRGYKWSQLELGKLYLTGQGVMQDFVQSYMWFNIACAGKTGAEKFACPYRDAVAQKMTPEQIDQAQTLSREWTPKLHD